MLNLIGLYNASIACLFRIACTYYTFSEHLIQEVPRPFVLTFTYTFPLSSRADDQSPTLTTTTIEISTTPFPLQPSVKLPLLLLAR
jgi:hypothetical protein